MKTRGLLLIAAMMMAMAGSALGVIAPCDDAIGVYFDLNADVNEMTAAPSVPFNVYVIVTNPTVPEIYGVEFGYQVIAAPGSFFRLSEILPAGALNVGNAADPALGDYVMGLASPVPSTQAVVMVTWSYLLLVPGPMEFYLGPAVIESIPDGLPALGFGGSVIPLNYSTGGSGFPSATVNTTAPFPGCGNPPLPPVDPVNIAIEIDAFAVGQSDTGNLAATDSTATLGYDSTFDIPQPGPPPSNYIVASFNHPEWPLGPRFQTDYQPSYIEDKEVKTWPLMVETDIDGEVRLDFTTSFTPDIKVRFHLRDLQTGTVHDMLGVPSFTFDNLGENTYHFEIVVENIRPLPVDPTSRDLPGDWTLVGMPLYPDLGYRSVDEALVSWSPSQPFVYDYTPGSGYGAVEFSETWTQGNGYWFGAAESFNWAVPGVRDLNGTLVPLTQGWNIVGSPMWFPAAREGIVVRHGGAEYTWDEAATAGLVAGTIVGYDDDTSAYVNVDSLRAWRGYWVAALDTGVDLWFHWAVFDELTVPTNKSWQGIDTRDYWQTALTATTPDKKQRTVTLGVRPDASPGFDPAFDAPQPPPSPKGGPRFGVQHPEWSLPCGSSFSVDYLPTESETVHWATRLVLTEPGPVILDWQNLHWPDDLDLQLYLPADNRVIVDSMRDEGRITVNVTGTSLEVVVRTRTQATSVEDTPEYVYHLGVHPNPFNPRTEITYEVPQAGRVDIRVYTVRGELVSVLDGGVQTPGRYTLTWQGRDDQGRELPSGSYFARMSVDGQPRADVVKMSLIR